MKNRSVVPLGFAVSCIAAGTFALVLSAAVAAPKPARKAAQTHLGASGQSTAAPNSSGHAKSIAVDHAGGNGVRTMDHGNTGAGENPLYEGKDKDAAKPPVKPATGAGTVEYKDPEDMTTRYRPGNNKTTGKSNSKASKGATSPH